MGQDGWRGYFIIGEQTDWNTVTASPKEIIYEFISETLRGASDPITPTRIHGNPSPVKNIPGMLNAGGDIAMHLHTEHMLMFWTQLLMDDPSVVANADEIVRADNTFTATESLDTQPSATTPPCDPEQLTVTFSLDQTGTVVIAGTDQNGTAISETLTFAANKVQTTAKYFQTVDANGITISSGIVSTGGNLLIECDKNTYTHTFTLGDNVYVEGVPAKHGLTIEMVKGTIPNTYIGCILNTGVFDLADTVTFTPSILAKQCNYREAIDGTGTPTDISGYAQMVDTDWPYGDDVYPGWGMAVQLDSVQTDIESASFSFGNNLDYPTRYKASRPMSKPVRQGDREIGMTCAVDYEAVADGGVDFDDKYYGDVPIAVILSAIRKPYAGPEYSIQLTMQRCQLIAHPDPEVSAAADITQELSFRPIRSVGASISNEVSLQIVSTELTE